jgi:hypothetical protein
LIGEFRLKEIRRLGRNLSQPERLHRFRTHRLVPGDLSLLTLWILFVLIKNDLVGAFALIAKVPSLVPRVPRTSRSPLLRGGGSPASPDSGCSAARRTHASHGAVQAASRRCWRSTSPTTCAPMPTSLRCG